MIAIKKIHMYAIVSATIGFPLSDGYTQVKINEFQANNVSTYPDIVDYDDFSDWIELYNEGGSEADIGGYYLTGDLKQKKKWQIPTGTSIPAKGYLLIWTDDYNAKPGTKGTREWYTGGSFTARGYHTNFCLDKDGEQVGLFDASGAVIDSVTFPPQHADVSMGRTSDGKWAFFDEPTPGAANSTTAKQATQHAGTVTFSEPGGFYSSARSVTLAAPDGSDIYYTTDCSIPFSGDTKYDGPISVSKTTVIRARCITNDKFAGKVVTNTYFINEKTRKVMTVAISSEPAFLFDKEIGIYKNSFKGMEIPVSIEFFETDGKQVVNANAGMRLGSLTNYTVAQKPLQIAMRERYGDPTVNYQFFSKPITKFDRFRLRDGGDAYNSSIINDALLDPICTGQTAVGIQAFRMTIVYINGEYYGLQDLREQFKDMYFSENYGVANPEERDEVRSILKSSSGGGMGSMSGEGWELVNGTWDSRKSLVSLVKSGTIDDTKYAQIKEIVDIAGMTDFFCLIHFAKAISWGHNQDIWTIPGVSKWKWLITDFDRAFVCEDSYSKIDANQFTTSIGVSPKIADDTLLSKLVTNTEFKNYFVQRYAAHLGSTLKTSRLNAITDSIAEIYDLEMADHVAKWGKIDGVKSVSTWKSEVNTIKKFMNDRPQYVWEHLAESPFKITGGRADLTVKLNPSDAKADILINGVPMSQGLSGISLFKGIPFQIRGAGKTGWKCAGWDGGSGSTTDSMTVTLGGNQTLTANFNPAGIIHGKNMQPGYDGTVIHAQAISYHGAVHLTLYCPIPANGHFEVSLFNIAGEKIECLKDSKVGSGRMILHLTSKKYAAGVYYYRATAMNKVTTGVVTIQ